MTSDQTTASIRRLASALHELNYRGPIRIRPEIQLLLSPGTPDATTADLHVIGMTPQTADLLADAIERLLCELDAPVLPTDEALAAAVAEIFKTVDAEALADADKNLKDVDE